MRLIDGPGGGVLVDDGVRSPRPVTGPWLEQHFLAAITEVTFGLITLRDRALFAGPVPLLAFGAPVVGAADVSWPITGGVLAASAGGTLSARSAGGRLEARVEGYRPMLPLGLYRLTQLRLHHALVRMQLLALRGRRPAPGVPAEATRRALAGAVDVALCACVALALSRKRPISAFAGIAAGYHVAAWTSSGRTLGGVLMGQRVVAVDGSRPSLTQSLLRFALLPIAAARMRGIHDEVAATDVIAG